jgi:two-component system, response regulator
MHARLKILLVEDDSDDYNLFAEALDNSGQPYEITWASRCETLFDIVNKDQSFDLIFLDINLPGVDGHLCLKQLKESRKFGHIPVMMYSGSKSEDDIEKAYEGGAHHYVIKPYAISNLTETLKKIFLVNWKEIRALPRREDFVINTAFVE